MVLVDAIGDFAAPRRRPADKIGAVAFAHHPIARLEAHATR
jgi:hypothetical protein